MCHNVEQGTKNPRVRGLEISNDLGLWPALILGDWFQREENSPVCKIRVRHKVFDPVQDHRPGGIEQNFVVVTIELTYGDPAAGCESAECVGNPCRQARHIVE